MAFFIWKKSVQVIDVTVANKICNGLDNMKLINVSVSFTFVNTVCIYILDG